MQVVVVLRQSVHSWPHQKRETLPNGLWDGWRRHYWVSCSPCVLFNGVVWLLLTKKGSSEGTLITVEISCSRVSRLDVWTSCLYQVSLFYYAKCIKCTHFPEMIMGLMAFRDLNYPLTAIMEHYQNREKEGVEGYSHMIKLQFNKLVV